ncbi:MAG: tetratricopeptide repeat protein [Oscillatoriales cyanobacterium]|uniref:Tetratricopeptide repeat protein n=1 Tax=Microcoleus anatoxicus PTRS2 TaxID=2705321 RepID=A0ABU8YSC5_9CYAN|nr:MAG: tetratricopeptide repeat protein [Oscillatoriales cyanobacterium]TAD94162.1 MAG: tetratricopeptide repeat protein [Oscillatoriales cyanobacterium]TAE06942.1 MAG: tetratricopeptide repeat protein [Oscillatoriales cyanobacterium]TAF06482.1 MAG: tetratricopeptide repeat protein [Oscillatoriales cyanobacterium]TAF45509.1 MAG: tetratricopeptide repeat protein [Oscillatoriales cyanobacterium]
MDLTLCMIVKNEEVTLPQTLASVQDVVDEMVVLDTGSGDRTCEIAREFGARVYHFEWGDDFAAARNECLKYATGDWILVLDADEVLVPEILPHIKQGIQGDRTLVINLIRQEIGASQSPYSLVSRLFRHRHDIRFSRPYHAMVDDSVAEILQREPEWKIAALAEVAILHSGYQQDAIATKNKFQKAQVAMERYITYYPNDAYACSKLGALYVESGQIQRGIDLLTKGLTVVPIDDSIIYELNYHLGIAYRHQQQFVKAKEHYQAAINTNVFPAIKLGAYNNLGNLLKDEGDLTSAEKAYKAALKIDPNFATGHYNLGLTLKAGGNLADAIAYYRQAIKIDPEHAEAHQNLAVALLKIGKMPESLAEFKKAIVLHEQRRPFEAERLRRGLQEMGLI